MSRCVKVLERFIPCVHDGSSKVTVSALRVLSHIAQPLSTLMMSQSIHLTLLVQALTSNLASNSRLILDETFTALDKVTDCMGEAQTHKLTKHEGSYITLYATRICSERCSVFVAILLCI